ncbi:type II toxin-antitoxin system VapC family toxin [Comamonas sp. NLF-1-9]|uniref:type II toxin-antitoxin system VapC family toxin n=1 Tax=Comamonas sp. NLF-1-9 TaxID=2853163 RepID=UPI001C476798|nr:type II toxin-antitoxin system VapC family toxin [Comamonas sp. NLF-1-9]QXL83234.1 type II toxin-antitoxin system VapC family toxin [Comamonas sp. NLF-1-9]
MFLADTNILSELMRPRPNAGVRQWLTQSGVRLAISVVTIDEILFGMRRRPAAASLALFDALVANNLVLDVTETIARRAGEMRADLSLRGQVRSQADMLIAATAQVHALTLVTRNVRDFDGCGIALLNPFSA